MNEIRSSPLAEDNPNDVEFTRTGLTKWGVDARVLTPLGHPDRSCALLSIL